jgi:hypothetical protein
VQGRRIGVIADLPCRDKEAKKATIGISHGVQLGIYTAFSLADLASEILFPPRLDAVRCALR